ncbi:MAG: HAD family phosphatase [Candidatus Paceibacterota bacterium]
MAKEKLKGILFDLDGVLFDTEYYQWQGWAEPLKEYGIELTKEIYFNYAGKSWKYIDSEMIHDFNLPLQEGELWEKKKSLIEKWFTEKAMPLMPFAKEAVEYFHNNPKFKLGLCSGGDKEEVIAKLEKNNFLKYFSIIVAGDDVKNSKPAPDIYLAGIKKIGLMPKECVAIEDTQYGLQSAKDAGLACFVVPNEYSEKQDFSRADKIFKSLKELVGYFNSNE